MKGQYIAQTRLALKHMPLEQKTNPSNVSATIDISTPSTNISQKQFPLVSVDLQIKKKGR